MKVELAKTAGFCFGVKRAVDTVYKQIEAHPDSPIYTYGPIIHNEEVIKDMKKHGVKVIGSAEELENLDSGIVIIRSHGVAKEVYDLLTEKGLTCVDATCPFVKKIHKIAQEQSAQGAHIVVIGNSEHPEVQGIKGWSGNDVTVIQTVEEAKSFQLKNKKQKLCVVSQTTFNYNKFKDIVEIIEKKRYDILVLNTICSATEERQTEAGQIASKVDAMIVIGGSHSSNTQKLFEICKKECENTYYIQSLDDLDLKTSESIRCVGITAGASTPNKIIEEVQKHVRIKF